MNAPDLTLNNRLPILAAEIQRAHEGVLDAAKTTAERAIDAGKALLEAKKLVGHGRWQRWLCEHCRLPERTAQFYMKIAKSGLEPAIVADLGLAAASKVEWTLHDPDYNPFSHCGADGERVWGLFVLYLASVTNMEPEGAAAHVEWLLNKQFVTPDEWLGDEGTNWRSQCGMRTPTDKFKAGWSAFAAERSALSVDDIKSKLEDLGGARAKASRRRRGKARR